MTSSALLASCSRGRAGRARRAARRLPGGGRRARARRSRAWFENAAHRGRVAFLPIRYATRMGKSAGKTGVGQGSISIAQLDRNLVPRVEQYALNRDVSDLDAVVDYLRRSYKEYQRRQVGALRQMVLKAVQIVQRKSLSKPALVLQVGALPRGGHGRRRSRAARRRRRRRRRLPPR
jgi:hypothetical protein